ncbi:MAG: hypothetical protein ACK58T_07850, partial [Phycisphaerae bacterium]
YLLADFSLTEEEANVLGRDDGTCIHRFHHMSLRLKVVLVKLSTTSQAPVAMFRKPELAPVCSHRTRPQTGEVLSSTGLIPVVYGPLH